MWGRGKFHKKVGGGTHGCGTDAPKQGDISRGKTFVSVIWGVRAWTKSPLNVTDGGRSVHMG